MRYKHKIGRVFDADDIEQHALDHHGDGRHKLRREHDEKEIHNVFNLLPTTPLMRETITEPNRKGSILGKVNELWASSIFTFIFSHGAAVTWRFNKMR
eukprot:451718-Amphidinium_carterae.1